MSAGGVPLRVASYNIRKAVGTDRRRDPGRILDVIAGLGADVVVLQEADLRLGARPSALPLAEIAPRTGLTPVAVATSPVSLGWHGIAVLARPGVAASLVRRLALPGLEPRGAIVLDLEAPQGALRLVAVHLGLLRGSRRRQLAAIRAVLDDAAPRPVVIAGDFNEWSRRRGLAALGPGLMVHAPGRSFHARRPVAALDRFAVGGGAAVGASGVRHDPVTALASDHLPVWADIRLGPGD